MFWTPRQKIISEFEFDSHKFQIVSADTEFSHRDRVLVVDQKYAFLYGYNLYNLASYLIWTSYVLKYQKRDNLGIFQRLLRYDRLKQVYADIEFVNWDGKWYNSDKSQKPTKQEKRELVRLIIDMMQNTKEGNMLYRECNSYNDQTFEEYQDYCRVYTYEGNSLDEMFPKNTKFDVCEILDM